MLPICDWLSEVKKHFALQGRFTNMNERRIIHIDMDAFFAAVEQRDFPELRGKPVAVGGSSLRGVVASASYEARKFGVRSAMPSVTAKRQCPNLIFVKSRFKVYKEVSEQIRSVFYEYTDLVEPLSLDEAYLDVTENKKQIYSGTLIANEIRARIEAETGLTASAGVSFNKFLAKTASDINKPNGICVITPAEAEAFLESLKIEKFYGIGKVTAKKMKAFGIHTGKDLKARSELELVQRFGKAGRHYYRIVRARDDRAVNPHRIRKSIGTERTFSEDITNLAEMKVKVLMIAEMLFADCKRLDNYGRTVTLKAKTPDFRQITRSKSYGGEVRTLADLQKTATDLLEENAADITAVRLLGVAVSNLSRELPVGEGIQLEFDFTEEEE